MEWRSKWTRSSRSAPDPLDPGPAGFAHRGAHSAGVPENSLAAFRGALAIGAGIECDLRLTADDRVIVFHDADAVRLCGNPLVIARSTQTEIARLELAGEPIPTLGHLLELASCNVPLLLEIKTADDVDRWGPALATALSRYAGAFGIMSFDPMLCRELKLRLPDVRRGLVVAAGLSAFRRKLALSLASPHFLAVDRAALGQPWVASLRRRMPVYSWTIRTPDQRAQAEVHADALIWEADGGPRI
ncbi:MAG: glycerophosphodiester phosphodiesterase [Sphingomonas sp.]|nr:glycerophosphodiester phosphodiesterase [Sphingomonas sp.]